MKCGKGVIICRISYLMHFLKFEENEIKTINLKKLL